MSLTVSAILSLSFLASGGVSAFEMTTTNMRFVNRPNQEGDRVLQLAEDSQCFLDSKELGEGISDRGINLRVNANCHNSNYCQADATDHHMYDDFLRACGDLNGEIYTYDMKCRIVWRHDYGTETANLRWNSMAACFAPVCTRDDVMDALTEYLADMEQTSSTGGASIVSATCSLEDVTAEEGTVIAENQDLDVIVRSGAWARALSFFLLSIGFVVSIL